MGVFSPFVEPRSGAPSPVSLQLREVQAQLLVSGPARFGDTAVDTPWELPPGAFDTDAVHDAASSHSRGSSQNPTPTEATPRKKRGALSPPTALAWWSGPPAHFKHVVAQRTFLELLQSPNPSEGVPVRSYSDGDLQQELAEVCSPSLLLLDSNRCTRFETKDRSKSDSSRSRHVIEHETFVEFLLSPRSSAASELHGQSGEDASCSTPQSSSDLDTTLFLRHLPGELLQEDLVEILDKLGFAGCYDLVFLPMDLDSGLPAGCATVNAVDHKRRTDMESALKAFQSWGFGDLPCTVEPAARGLASLVEEYREHTCNSGDAPPHMRPLLFVNGWPVAFPAATGKARVETQDANASSSFSSTLCSQFHERASEIALTAEVASTSLVPEFVDFCGESSGQDAAHDKRALSLAWSGGASVASPVLMEFVEDAEVTEVLHAELSMAVAAIDADLSVAFPCKKKKTKKAAQKMNV